MADEMVLRGFDMPMADIGDQLHFRLPLLSSRGSPTLYLAGRVDWNVDRRALLTVVDDPEDCELATLLTDGVSRSLAPGEGVIVAGAEFFHAASRVGDELDSFSHLSAAGCECWIHMAPPAEFVALERKLIDQSRAVFDQELGKARRQRSRLMERGNAAMLVLGSCGPLRREDLAIRQLAAAKQNRDFDLYRRLLVRFEHELGETEDRLHKQAGRHIELAEMRFAKDEGGSWEVGRDLEDTLRTGASIIESVADVMRNVDVLGVDAKRRCTGRQFEENLKRVARGVEEIEEILSSVHDP